MNIDNFRKSEHEILIHDYVPSTDRVTRCLTSDKTNMYIIKNK